MSARRVLAATMAIVAALAVNAAQAGPQVQWSVGIEAPLNGGVFLGGVFSGALPLPRRVPVIVPTVVVQEPAAVWSTRPVEVAPVPVVYQARPGFERQIFEPRLCRDGRRDHEWRSRHHEASNARWDEPAWHEREPLERRRHH